MPSFTTGSLVDPKLAIEYVSSRGQQQLELGFARTALGLKWSTEKLLKP